jgi:hypothetical protein
MPQLSANLSADERPDEGRFGTLAAPVSANGYSCLPIPPGSKKTLQRGWSRYCRRSANAETVAAWVAKYPDHGLALACGGVLVVDIDEDDPVRAAELQAMTFLVLGATPLVRIGRAPRMALVYRVQGPSRIASTKVGKVDILADGRYVLAYGIHPTTRKPYSWVAESPATLPLAAVPPVTSTAAYDLIARLRIFFGVSEPSRSADAAKSAGDNKWSPSSRAATSDPRWTCDENGRVVDGREAYITALIYAAFARGLVSADQIANDAWRTFAVTADLARPKRDGKHGWAYSDAKHKARELIRRGKPRPEHKRERTPGFWTPGLKQSFLNLVDSAGAKGLLSPSTVAVSRAMLAHIVSGSSCFASTVTLSTKLGLAVTTVKKARRILVQAGFWTIVDTAGGRGRTAHYVPDPAALTISDPFGIASQKPTRSVSGSVPRQQTVYGAVTQKYREEGENYQDNTDEGESGSLSPNVHTKYIKSSASSGPVSPTCHDSGMSDATDTVAVVPQS